MDKEGGIRLVGWVYGRLVVGSGLYKPTTSPTQPTLPYIPSLFLSYSLTTYYLPHYLLSQSY